jgi:3-hydroxyacyl-[acyl-carrier-protein] dehydratase
MVPTAEFDDPELLRRHFELLSSSGSVPGRLHELPSFQVLPDGMRHPSQLCTTLQVPAEGAFFADHFPRRPVFPGTLLMQANQETASMLAAGIPSRKDHGWQVKQIQDVKLRTFISPGETLALCATQLGTANDELQVQVEARTGKRLVGSAEILFQEAVAR